MCKCTFLCVYNTRITCIENERKQVCATESDLFGENTIQKFFFFHEIRIIKPEFFRSLFLSTLALSTGTNRDNKYENNIQLHCMRCLYT